MGPCIHLRTPTRKNGNVMQFRQFHFPDGFNLLSMSEAGSQPPFESTDKYKDLVAKHGEPVEV